MWLFGPLNSKSLALWITTGAGWSSLIEKQGLLVLTVGKELISFSEFDIPLIQSLCSEKRFDFAFGKRGSPFTSSFTFSAGCRFISSGVQCPWYIHGNFCQVKMPSPYCEYGLSKSCPILIAVVDSSVHAFALSSLLLPLRVWIHLGNKKKMQNQILKFFFCSVFNTV